MAAKMTRFNTFYQGLKEKIQEFQRQGPALFDGLLPGLSAILRRLHSSYPTKVPRRPNILVRFGKLKRPSDQVTN